jgi:hypothetical protein
MSNTADVTGGKPVAVWSQSTSGVSAINPLVAFYDIDGRKGEVLLFCFVPDTTQDFYVSFQIVGVQVRMNKSQVFAYYKSIFDSVILPTTFTLALIN